ncbi:MAG TPA: PAAR-like protein, partial [Caldilineaceae bacterium]|nr:PAAR-like protein [Caldilineaceae bacterium]
ITLSNPQVAAATSAALGVLTPQPCIPVTTQPWAPGSPMVTIRNQPALNNGSTCLCQWGGVITITNPGQTKVTIP